jgi:hypothetical protein
MRWAGKLAHTGEMYVQGFVGKPEEKRQLGIPRRRWEDNINMDLQEIGRGH